MKPDPKLLILLMLLTLLLAGCGAGQPQTALTPSADGVEGFGAVISATGLVIPEQWTALSAHSQGIIAEVLVTEGQQVSAGQLLIRLDGQAAAQANLSAAQTELLNAQQALETLRENASTETARAQQAVANAMQAVHDAQEDVDKLDYPRASDDLITQTQNEIDLAKKAVSRAEDAYKLVKKRPDGDTVKAEAELALVQARMYLDNRISFLNWYTGSPDQLETAKYRAALALAQADLARAQTEFERRKNGPEPRLLELAQARLTQAQTQVQAAEETVANLELRAPFAGVVCNLEARVGEWIAPGLTILQLGDLDHLQVETTDLSEIDAARVQPQASVLVTFDALPNVTVPGTVLRVADKSAAGSRVNYTAVIVLENLPSGLRWGMTAFADIQVNE